MITESGRIARKCKRGHLTEVGGTCRECASIWHKTYKEKRKQRKDAGEYVPPVKKYKPKPKKAPEPPPPQRILVDEWTEFNQYGYARKRFYG